MVDPISISKDLELLVKARLVDIRMREDGEWIYSASEYSKSLTEEELTNILDNLDEYE
jgi:DNA-binding transcriptional ArsR family regulator